MKEVNCLEVIINEPGGYRFIKGVFPYSAGVSSLLGFAIERVRFKNVVPMAEGFQRIASHLGSLHRPLTALCACELRSPEPFTEEGFRGFNRDYGDVLKQWDIFVDGINPITRSNVCPELKPPSTPGFFAFSYTVPVESNTPTFVIAGCGEVPEGKGNYRDHIVSLADTSPEGILLKARWVLGEQERRLNSLGFQWKDVTATQLYTIHDPHQLLASEFAARGVMDAGLTWHYCRPPVEGIEFEMDCRGIGKELVV